jgi:hypothetical protein
MPDEQKLQNFEHDIDAMAKQFALPTSVIHDILWSEIHDLERAARITDFVPVLALKHVKDTLRRRPAVPASKDVSRR